MDQHAKQELMSIVDELSAEDRAFIASFSEDKIIRLHHGLGTYIRNANRGGRFGALFRWAETQLGTERRSFDALSWPILVEVWRALQGRRPD